MAEQAAWRQTGAVEIFFPLKNTDLLKKPELPVVRTVVYLWHFWLLLKDQEVWKHQSPAGLASLGGARLRGPRVPSSQPAGGLWDRDIAGMKGVSVQLSAGSRECSWR